MTSVKRKQIKCSGLFHWETCNVKGRRSQGLMAAPGLIEAPRNNSKSCKILKNNIFPYSVKVVPGKNKRKTHRKLKRLAILAKIPKRITSNLGNPKFWLRGGQRLKLRHDSDGCPLRLWPLERREGTLNSFHATRTRCSKKKKLQNLSLILSDDHKWSIFHFFCYETSELTLVAIVAKPEVKIAPTE